MFSTALNVLLGGAIAIAAAGLLKPAAAARHGATTADYPAAVPNVFGAAALGSPNGFFHGVTGQLFAFSGLDGPTNSSTNFVGLWGHSTTGAPRFTSNSENHNRYTYDLRLGADHPAETWLQIRTATRRDEVLVATNAVVVASHADGMVKLAWEAWDLLVGTAPATATVKLDNSTRVVPPKGSAAECELSPGGHVVLCKSSANGADSSYTLGVSYASGDEQMPAAIAKAAAAAASGAASIENVVAARLAWISSMPRVSGGLRRQRLLNKVVSVMRVNSLAPEGDIAQHWSTPDRLPHKYMWLWDSCYHSMARSVLNDTLGWQFVQSMLSVQLDDGFVPIQRSPLAVAYRGENQDNEEKQTQPPLLTWAIMENYRLGKLAGTSNATLHARLAYAAPRLAKYLQWDMVHRGDPTGATPLLFWIKGTESGMDNSPRFDDYNPDKPLLAVDFSVFVAREAKLLSQMWSLLGRHDESSKWETIASNISSAIHATLWDSTRGLYFDRHTTRDGGAFSNAAAVSGLLPLWLPDIPKDRIATLVSRISNTHLFNTRVPLSSVAANSSTFSTDMWRGPMWLNTNYHVVLALLDKNFPALAHGLMEASVSVVGDWYEKYGVVFEFYDATNATDPTVLSRKGHTNCGGVRDYHWTAALTFRMLLALEEGQTN